MAEDSAGRSLTAEDCQRIRDAHGAFGKALCRRTLDMDQAGDIQFVLSAMWLNERLDEANVRLSRNLDAACRSDSPSEDPFSGAAGFMRMWVRVYYLFSSQGRYQTPRLTPENERRILELMCGFAREKSRLKRAENRRIWHIHESESRDMLDLGNTLLALQAHPDPKEAMPDGRPVREHLEAWTSFFRAFCDERARHGLFVEINSPVNGQWFLPELVNLFEFARDGLLRKKTEMLLHLIWADWAVDQLNGVRGGGRTGSSQGKYSQQGLIGTWRRMARILLGEGDWFDLVDSHANYIVATTNYRLPDVVIDLALDPAGRGEYVYRSKRPARVHSHLPRELAPLEEGLWYVMNTRDPRLVRYSFSTPDFILGSLWVDPALGVSYRPATDASFSEKGAYAALSARDRWHGIIFATHSNARVYPQCIGRPHGGANPTFNQQIAVQFENVMIARKCDRIENDLPGMRVFFSEGLRARAVESQGWVCVQEGNAWLAVGILPGRGGKGAGAFEWEDQHWLRLRDEFAPVVLVAGRLEWFPSPAAFIEYVQSHRWQVRDAVLTYSFTNRQGEHVRLAMPLEGDSLPSVDGVSISLNPAETYNAPYLFSHGGGKLITIRKGRRALTFDFPRTEVTLASPLAQNEKTNGMHYPFGH